jgi:hypothetical protein
MVSLVPETSSLVLEMLTLDLETLSLVLEILSLVPEMLNLAPMVETLMLHGRGQEPQLDYLQLLRGGSDLPLHKLAERHHQAIASTLEMLPEMLRDPPFLKPGALDPQEQEDLTRLLGLPGLLCLLNRCA